MIVQEQSAFAAMLFDTLPEFRWEVTGRADTFLRAQATDVSVPPSVPETAFVALFQGQSPV